MKLKGKNITIMYVAITAVFDCGYGRLYLLQIFHKLKLARRRVNLWNPKKAYPSRYVYTSVFSARFFHVHKTSAGQYITILVTYIVHYRV